MLIREGMEEDFGGYGYPFADVVGDRLVAHIRPIQIIANILAGGQGGGNLSTQDRRRMARVVEQYYEKAGLDLPESVADLAKGHYMDKPMEEEQGHDDDLKKPMAKNEQVMKLRDHLVAAAALVDAMLEGYDENEEMPEDEAPVVQDSAKVGGARQERANAETLVAALKAAVAAIGGSNNERR
jgi:hypothetical protein